MLYYLTYQFQQFVGKFEECFCIFFPLLKLSKHRNAIKMACFLRMNYCACGSPYDFIKNTKCVAPCSLLTVSIILILFDITENLNLKITVLFFNFVFSLKANRRLMPLLVINLTGSPID